MLRIQVRGAREIASALSDEKIIDDILRPAFKEASVIIEGAARDQVHVVTRKLMGSLGHQISGRGSDLEARIGPQPGLAAPRQYQRSETGRWKKPRRGWNKGDPQEYATFEEHVHPFLEPALDENIDRIENAVERSAERRLRQIRGA